MAGFGREVIGTVGGSIQVCANNAEWKVGGVTIDWGTVTAVSADTELMDGFTVADGKKYLRYGQFVTMIGVAEVQTVVVALATGGTFTLTLPTASDEPAETTAAIAYDTSAAAAEAAMNALTRIGPGGATVAKTGTMPMTLTMTFARSIGNVPTLTSNAALLTSGSTATITHATTTSGEASGGKFGPYDPDATDGRQTLAKGSIFMLNRSIREEDAHSSNIGVLSGGTMWRDRMLCTDGTHTLAAGPTLTEINAVMPRIEYILEK